MVAGDEPQRAGRVGVGEQLVGLAAGMDHELRPQFERIAQGVPFGRLVQPIREGEIAQVAHLQQAGQRLVVLALPGARQGERRQNPAVQIAKDEIGGHGPPLP